MEQLKIGCWGCRCYIAKRKNPKWSTMMHIHVCNEDAIKLIRRLLPYLIVKRKQAEIALDFWDLKQKKFEQYGKYNSAGMEYAGNMETLKQGIHSLNGNQGFKGKI